MIIDDKTFLDLTVHLRHASDELVVAAQRLSQLCDPSRSLGQDRRELVTTLDSLVAMNKEFTCAGHLMRAVWDANRPAAHRSC